MSIAQKVTTEFGQTVTLYRWECLLHPKACGVWVKDREIAEKGMRAHLGRHPAPAAPDTLAQ